MIMKHKEGKLDGEKTALRDILFSLHAKKLFDRSDYIRGFNSGYESIMTEKGNFTPDNMVDWARKQLDIRLGKTPEVS